MPVVSASKVTFPVEYKTIQKVARAGISHRAERQYWWPVFAMQTTHNALPGYPDVRSKAQKALSACKGGGKVRNMDELQALLVSTFEIAETRFFDPLFRLVSAEFEGHADALALVFFIFECVLANRERFCDFSASAFGVSAATFRDILHKSMPQTSASLIELHALEDAYLEAVFVDCFRALLQPANLLSVVDAFLLEGNIVLFQYALGLVHTYKKQIKQKKFRSGADFWARVRSERARDFESIRAYAFETVMPSMSRLVTRRYSLSGQSLKSIGIASGEIPRSESSDSRVSTKTDWALAVGGSKVPFSAPSAVGAEGIKTLASRSSDGTRTGMHVKFSDKFEVHVREDSESDEEEDDVALLAPQSPDLDSASTAEAMISIPRKKLAEHTPPPSPKSAHETKNMLQAMLRAPSALKTTEAKVVDTVETVAEVRATVPVVQSKGCCSRRK